MNKTRIEWIVNPDGSRPGWSWNPLTGCLNNCSYCFARKLANGRLRNRYLEQSNVAPLPNANELPDFGASHYKDPFYPRFWENRLEDPLKVAKPCGIFVVDMGELFGDWLPYEWQEKIFDVIKRCPQHRFYLLTKQFQNLVKFSPFSKNCWVGVSCTTAQQLYDAWSCLFLTGAKIKFVSFEPLLERMEGNLENIFEFAGIGWVIIGAQTNPYNPPKLEWIEEIVEACDKAGIPVFLKDNLRQTIPISWFTGEPLSSLYKDGKLRQEMPEGTKDEIPKVG